MEVSTAKAISMLALGLGSFLVGMLPACFSDGTRRKHPLLLSCLLCFGGGVLLSTSLAHMLPEAREKLPENSEVTLCIGFFIVYLVDELVHYYNRCDARNKEEETRLLSNGMGSNLDLAEIRESRSSTSGIIGLLCALFVHSVLEGLAIGLQERSSQVLLLLGAVASHKYVVGFCLGAECAENAPGRLCGHIVCMVLFSGGSVLGIAIGAGLETVEGLKESAVVPVLQALAAGTLMYVTVSEVLPRERSRWHEKKRGAGLAQFFAMTIGFVLMYLTTAYLDYDDV